MKTEKVKALFISDTHIGSKHSNCDQLMEVLRQYSPERLYLVGDFIDGWRLQKRHYWEQSNTNVIRKILSYTKHGTEVFYVIGNHDDFMRQYDELNFGLITITEEVEYDGFLITHGDRYDGVVKLRWLGKLGGIGYEYAMGIDRSLKKLGLRRSLSHLLKTKVKDAVKFITDFENELARQAINRGCRGVICGHIHKPEDKTIHGIRYLNCGDWIENNSYIIHTMEGDYVLRYYVHRHFA